MICIADLKKRILFISLNRHQRHYFCEIGNFLRNFYEIYHVDYSTSALSDILSRTSLEALPAELGFTKQDIEEIISFLLIKRQYRKFGFIRRYLHSKSVLEAQACSSLRFFYEYIVKNNIDLVCVWNGILIPLAAATRVATRLGKKTMFFENGYLPDTTTVDPKGVNYANSLVGKSRSFYENVQIDPVKLRQLYKVKPAIRALKSKWYQRFINKKKQGQPEDIQLPARYIFVPFQVHDDTQVLLNSPKVKTMTALLNTVVPAIEHYNREANDSIQLVVKEHPSDFGRISYDELRQQYQGRGIIFLRYYPTPQLINSSLGILTINSTVGIEAFVQHKPVITMGNAFYNVPGLTVHAADITDLTAALSVVNEQVDNNLIDKFLYYLRYHYLAAGSWRQADSTHLKSIKEKISASLAEV